MLADPPMTGPAVTGRSSYAAKGGSPARSGQELGLRCRELLVGEDAGLLERCELLELSGQVRSRSGWSRRRGVRRLRRRCRVALVIDGLLLGLLLRGLIRVLLLLVVPDRPAVPAMTAVPAAIRTSPGPLRRRIMVV